MKFLAKLMRGDVALWCIFWLIGVPLVILWDGSGICTIVGCGIQDPSIGGLLLVLFALSTVAILFVSVGVWRSASKYPRKAWWQGFLARVAQACAAFSAVLAAIGLLVLLYIAAIFIYAAFDRS
jgi:hypothetical protein